MNQTIETLVRILDDERTERKEATGYKAEYDYQLRRNNELVAINGDLRSRLAALEPRPYDKDYLPDLLRVSRDFVVPAVHKMDPTYYTINKIPFIKEVRERTGLGLKDAKDLVDEYIATLSR